MASKGGRAYVYLDQSPPQNSCRPAVDALFSSIGEAYGGAAIAAKAKNELLKHGSAITLLPTRSPCFQKDLAETGTTSPRGLGTGWRKWKCAFGWLRG